LYLKEVRSLKPNAWGWGELCYPVLGGNEYRDLALQVGRVTNETVKYDHEFSAILTPEKLLWRGPATSEKYRPDLLLERTPHINNPITV
jgi:hypothetical protein